MKTLTLLLSCCVMMLSSCVHSSFVAPDGTKFSSWAFAPPLTNVDTDSAQAWYEWAADGSGLIDTGRRTEGIDAAAQADFLGQLLELGATLKLMKELP